MVCNKNFWTDIIDQPLEKSAENVESIMQGQCEDVRSASRDLIDARFASVVASGNTKEEALANCDRALELIEVQMG